MTKYCEVCGKIFEKKVVESKKYWETKRFCSRSCQAKDPAKVEIIRQAMLKTFKEGRRVWNKGKKGLQVAWNKGNGEYAKQLGFGKWMKGRQGEQTNYWKGDDVGYTALHDWVRRYKGKPKECEECGLVSENGRMLHWANVSNEYKRDLDDWVRLCAKCHKKLDKGRKQKIFKRNKRR